jgi:hypothetical protein
MSKVLLASWGRSFLTAVLTLLMAGQMDVKTLAMGGAAAVIPVILRWLNPNDPAFGIVGK